MQHLICKNKHVLIFKIIFSVISVLMISICDINGIDKSGIFLIPNCHLTIFFYLAERVVRTF